MVPEPTACSTPPSSSNIIRDAPDWDKTNRNSPPAPRETGETTANAPCPMLSPESGTLDLLRKRFWVSDGDPADSIHLAADLAEQVRGLNPRSAHAREKAEPPVTGVQTNMAADPDSPQRFDGGARQRRHLNRGVDA